MKQVSTLFLRSVIMLTGLFVLGLMIYLLPVMAYGDIGGYKLILAVLYICAIPFYFVLYQAMKLLARIDKSQIFSDTSTKSLTVIKYGGIAISALGLAALPYTYHIAELDDAPGVILIAMGIIGISAVVATAATILQKLVQNAIDIKSENDLTV